MHYSAAWTDSGFFLGCSHEHETIVEADSCISCAGGYVVGIENGVMRCLTGEEEAEFQRVHYASRIDSPALRQQTEAASALVINALSESIRPRGEGETFVEFVLGLLTADGFDQHSEPISEIKSSVINTDMIDLVLSRLSEWETSKFERMYAADRHGLLEALGNRFRAVLKPKSGCH